MRLATVAALCLSMVGMAVAGNASAAITKMPTNIPAQGLGPALKTLAKDRGFQVVFRSEVVGSARTQGAAGNLTMPEALTELLKGTNLAYSYLDENTVTIVPSAPAATSAAADQSQTTTQDRGGSGKNLSGEFRVAQVDEGPAGPSEVDQRKDEEEKSKISEIVVTGTHIRGTSPAGSNVIVIGRDDIDRAGQTTTDQIIRALPQNFAGGPEEQNRIGGPQTKDASLSSSVNLRGLGAGSTLVLLNGHRMAPAGGDASFVDISSIPVAAIDRVEVLPDGASAIYGADAVGGVVNFILKDKFNGLDTRAQYDYPTGGGAANLQLSVTGGTHWETGSILGSYQYIKRDSLPSRDRKLTESTDLRPLGGDNFDFIGPGNPGTIFAGGNTYAIPAGQNGRSLNPSNFVAGTNNETNFRQDADLLGTREQNSIFTSIRQNAGDVAELFLDALYSKRRTETVLADNLGFLQVPQTNPFYVNPSGGTGPVLVEYNFRRDLPPVASKIEVNTYNAAAGATIDVRGDWVVTLSADYARERVDQLTFNQVDQTALTAALSDSNPVTAFNPFGDGSFTNPSTLAKLGGTTFFYSVSDLISADVIANGSIAQLPGGPVRLAVGSNYRHQRFQSAAEEGTDAPNYLLTDLARHVEAFFGEVDLPVFSSANARPGLQKLEVSLAGRYEKFSDFGSATTPKVGLTWAPADVLRVRSTWGRSFKAPNLPDLADLNNFLQPDSALDRNGNAVSILTVGGGNPNLTSETARVWTLGFDVVSTPALPARLSVTYFNTLFKNRIQSLPPGSYLTDPIYAPFVILNPNAQQLAAACRGFYFGSGNCTDQPVGAIVDLRAHNTAVTRMQGIDLGAGYMFHTSRGLVDVEANATRLLKFDQALVSTAPEQSFLNTASNPIDWRLRASATWTLGAYSASTFVNFFNSYHDNTSAPERNINSWTTVDVQLAYSVPKSHGGVLAGWAAALTAQNIFDSQAPFYNNPAGVGYDPTNANVLGRIVSLRISYSL